MTLPKKTGLPPPSGVVSLTIKERSGLYAAYMPYLNGGGIFFPTPRQYHLGDEVLMLLTLPEDPTHYPVAGTVVWITPDGTQGKMQGVGIQFNGEESGIAARKKIENLLGGTMTSTRPTHTM